MFRLIPPAVATLLLLAACTATPVRPGASAAVPAAPAVPAAFNEAGSADAPVTIIEFTDLQCPYCARHARETFPRLKRAYIDTGKVRYASRDLPLPIHAFALTAAVAARCAGEQGRFWEYRDALFGAQSSLATDPYARLAGDLGLDVARFEACRHDGQQEAAVRTDMALAARHGIVSTPTFVIGRLVDGQFQGEVVSGAQPYEAFASRLDALLAQPH